MLHVTCLFSPDWVLRLLFVPEKLFLYRGDSGCVNEVAEFLEMMHF